VWQDNSESLIRSTRRPAPVVIQKEIPMNRQITDTGSRKLWLLAGGSAAIILGLVFLAENLTSSDLDDLWALAMLPLALAFAARAVTIFERESGFTGAVAGWAVFALGTAVVALALVFGLDPGAMWPVFFIIAGAAAILATWR
jgi:hypothetical protein